MALTKDQVKQLFAPLEQGDAEGFFKHVADQVDWTVMGTHPLAGRYASKEAFLNATFRRLSRVMNGSVALKTNNVWVDGDTAIVELSTSSTAKNGQPFNNQYCWVCRFEHETIVEVRAYLDSELVKEVIEQNEQG
jgi:uncharacterized protein